MSCRRCFPTLFSHAHQPTNCMLLLLLQVTEYDAELRKAWFTAAAFKKR